MSPLKNEQIEAATDAEALVGLLVEADRPLPNRLRERILTFGPAVIPLLVTLLENEALSLEEAPGGGWAPIHAVELLAELQATAAIGPMLRLLLADDWESILHDTLLRELPRLGPAVLEPALALYPTISDLHLRSNLRGILADLGVRDERVYEILVEALELDEIGGGLAPMHLADYGDTRAIPLIADALDRYEFSYEPHLMANHAVIEYEDAIRRLGGELTTEQQEKVKRIIEQDRPQRDRFLSLLNLAVGRMDLESSPVRGARALTPEVRPARAARKVGRNDPCPCGSGKKYKKCCLDKER